MDTRPIATDVLGPEAERLVTREHAELRDLLGQLDEGQWTTTTPHGASLGALVDHLAEGAGHLATAVETRDQHEGRPLFDSAEPHGPADLDHDPGARGATTQRYRRATERLEHVLGLTRIRDWSWPSWSPAGGMETLAETTRRWVTHHFVHRHDILAATGRPGDDHDETLRLVIEHILDTMARRGGEDIDGGSTFELMTGAPGAGTWTLRFEDPQEVRRADLEIWQEIIGSAYELPAHRVERGPAAAPRASIRAEAQQVWRAAFSRGVEWSQLEVHGDDQGVAMWRRLTQRTG